MKPRKAISILEGQKEKLKGLNSKGYSIYLTTLLSYMDKFFGENSNQSAYIKEFVFIPKILPGSTEDKDPNWRKNIQVANKKQMSLFIDNCIELIMNNGVITSPKISSKGNWLESFNNYYLVGFFGMVFGVGFYFGSQKIEGEKIQLQNKNEKLSKSFDSLVKASHQSRKDTTKK